jgi:hypothetical protein
MWLMDMLRTGAAVLNRKKMVATKEAGGTSIFSA